MALPKDSQKLDVPLHKFYKYEYGQCGMELHNDFGCSLDIFEEIWGVQVWAVYSSTNQTMTH